MNKVRRKAIEKIAERMIDIRDDFKSLCDEEEEYLDNIPENLQSGDRYEAVEDTVFEMDEIYSVIEGTVEDLYELIVRR